MHVVEVNSLYFSYNGKNWVLEDINFYVKRGELIGIVGPNGAGKTTLIKLILGFLKPQKGSIYLFGKEIKNFREWNKLGYVPQRLSVEYSFPGKVKELLLSSSQDKREIEFLIDYLKIKDLLDKQYNNLSGGQQQKILLAAALSSNPDLIILDEPTVGLDVHSVNHLVNILTDLKEVHKKTILMVSHDIGILLKYSDKILCLKKKVCFFGKPEDALPYVEEIFGLRGILSGTA